MSLDKERDIMTEFIEIYRSEPCLWKISSKEYHNRILKAAAYDRLIEKLKEIDPDATRDKVVKKINNMRTTYRKEMKKIRASEVSGTGVDAVYVPTLWYFDLLDFLRDQEECRPTVSNVRDSREVQSEQLENQMNEQQSQETQDDFEFLTPGSPAMSDISSVSSNATLHSRQSVPLNSMTTPSPASTTSPSTSSTPHSPITIPSPKTSAMTRHAGSVPSRRRPGNKSKTDLTSEVLATVRDHFNKPRDLSQPDRFEIFGKNIGMKLRDLEKTQRILAEKIINDTLFEAEMGNLTSSHRLMDINSVHYVHTPEVQLPEDVTNGVVNYVQTFQQ